MKTLICASANFTNSFLQDLIKKGFELTFVQDERVPLKEQGIDPSFFELVICNGLFLYNDIKDFKSLKIIHLTSVGFDRVPLDYIKEKGIKIFNARGVYSIPMAEYAVTGVLELYKKSILFWESQNKKEWKKQREIFELFGKTVAIIGCGNVGVEVAKRFSAFGCKIIGVDLFEIKNDIFSEKYFVKDIKIALNKSDIVILTLPLTEQTENMFNEDLFSNFKDNSVLVNIARGKIVDENELIKALNDKLYGAVLDVFNEEPLKEDSPLWNYKNLVITPHNSFVGEGNIERLEKLILGNLA